MGHVASVFHNCFFLFCFVFSKAKAKAGSGLKESWNEKKKEPDQFHAIFIVKIIFWQESLDLEKNQVI